MAGRGEAGGASHASVPAHLRPIVLGDSATAERETHRRQVGGIKLGYAGFVPRAQAHYGSSHYGGLPFREGPKRNDFESIPAPQNRRSSDDIGRHAWNLAWSGHGKQAQVLTVAQQMGLKLPGQSHAGLDATAKRANSQQRVRPTSARRADHASAPSSESGVRPTTTASPIPSFRATSFDTMSRDHVSEPSSLYSNFRFNAGGIKPGYMGWVPKVSTQYGYTTFGGLHADAAGVDGHLAEGKSYRAQQAQYRADSLAKSYREKRVAHQADVEAGLYSA
jgi:hypothetical protein